MKRVLALTGILTLAMPVITYGATTSVSVQNTVDSSSNSDTTTTSESHVRIETNGEVKEFNTTGDDSVDWKSEDGKSTVKINNNNTTVNTKSDSSSQSDTSNEDSEASSSSTSTPEVDKQVNANAKKSEVEIPTSPIGMIVAVIKSLLSLL